MVLPEATVTVAVAAPGFTLHISDRIHVAVLASRRRTRGHPPPDDVALSQLRAAVTKLVGARSYARLPQCWWGAVWVHELINRIQAEAQKRL
jgi:hypothetical protein